jgi:ubiquinone/menaquinone biosynthesis C-methylase UbiE
MEDNDKKSFIRPEDFWRDLGLRAGQTVVHLGCGAGYYVVPAAQMVGQGGKVYGVDIREEMIQEAESKASHAGVEDIVQTVRADLENDHGSSLKNNIADWALVANILYQADPEKILREAARITKPGGTVVVVEWEPTAAPLGPPVEDRIAKQRVIDIAARLKLKPGKEFMPSPYHYGLLLTAP